MAVLEDGANIPLQSHLSICIICYLHKEPIGLFVCVNMHIHTVHLIVRGATQQLNSQCRQLLLHSRSCWHDISETILDSKYKLDRYQMLLQATLLFAGTVSNKGQYSVGINTTRKDNKLTFSSMLLYKQTIPRGKVLCIPT